MNRFVRRALPVLGLAIPALLVPTAGRAQAAAAGACEIDQNKPGSIPKATLSLARVQGAAQPADKQKALRDAVKALSEEKKVNENPVGRDYMLAQALVYWAAEPGFSGTVRRGDLGFVTEPDATIDVLAAADSAINRISAAKPGCASQMAQLRQNQAWLNQVNAAIQALNANKPDSAEFYARRSLLMYTGSPYAYHVLSALASQRNQDDVAVTNWTKVVELAGTDTSYRDLKNSALFNIAIVRVQAAEKATGDDQKAKAQEAITAMRAFLAGNPPAQDASTIQAQMARMLKLTGDEAAIASTYADQLANPSKYNDLALTQAGVTAAQAEKSADAVKLFEAALAQNPNQRDALNNLAASYYQLQQFDKIVPIVQRLVALDPANPDNYMFAAFAYQGLTKAAAKTPAKAKVYTDSLLLWKGRADKLPVKVSFTQFTRGAEKTTLVGQVEGIAATGKPYTLKFEFMDAQGNVVAAQEASAPAVAKGQKADFKVEVEKGGIVAFRYAPII